jgi:ATP-dependent helicase/nuclease subunit B
VPAILRISPAATGKTTLLANRARMLAHDISTRVRVIVPGYPQVRAWCRILARQGGALGIQVMTFPALYQQILDASGGIYTRLSAPVQFRLIQSILDRIHLQHYTRLRDKPGFIRALLNTIAELKAGRIWPESFIEAVDMTGADPRLLDIARIYSAYQEEMRKQNWVDSAGMGWLTAEALENNAHLCHDWPVLYIDGFDDLTPVQIDVLKFLAERVQEVIITLTGDILLADRMVHRRYDRTRERLLAKLTDMQVETGYVRNPDRNESLSYLESAFLNAESGHHIHSNDITLISTPNREGEVRFAMRWLKQRVVYDGTGVGDLALLARDIEPYRLYLQQIAKEFGMPIHLVHDLPLSENPAVAALLGLLSLPQTDYPRQRSVDAWFSPYFDWSRALGLEPQTYNRIQHSRLLQVAAIWGRIIGTNEQWLSVLDELSSLESGIRQSYEADELPANLPVGSQAKQLLSNFKRFTAYLQPPAGTHPYRDFVHWLENLMGDYSEVQPDSEEDDETLISGVGLLDNVYTGPSELTERDLAALQAFKDVLRGFVRAEQTIERDEVDYPMFLRELISAVDSANYQLPIPADQEAILVGDAVQVRGIHFSAVAILGLAEGEFPTASREDPFLPDRDRKLLQKMGLEFTLSTESFEAGYFYDAITRPSAKLLLTRPRLTDTGAQWQPSPYWLETQRLVGASPVDYISNSVPDANQLASEEEAVFYSAAIPTSTLAGWVERVMPIIWSDMHEAAAVVKMRLQRPGEETNEYEGNLSAYQSHFRKQFSPDYIWSASRLESYSTCPFMFYIGSVLDLEPRIEPEEGYDARQLGNIYHHIFESLYKAVDDPTDVEQLKALLPSIAGKILDEAPHTEQFRVTPWWMHSRQEICDNVQKSIDALHRIAGVFVPYAYEQPFGLKGFPPLVVYRDEGSFQMRGFIDRVDQSPDGALRIIDYKTAGPSTYTAAAVYQGKKMQLPLYALAARDALSLGYPVEGFYWHVRDAQASSFNLSKFGPDKAIHTSVDTAWDIIHNIQDGYFVPIPPRTGCPAYCPAATICWHKQAGYGA